jgi:hypothetical protein
VEYTNSVNTFDKSQRIAIAGALAAGIIGTVLTFSGIWTLPGASSRRDPANTPLDSQGNGSPYASSTSSRFEELLKNGPSLDAEMEELYLGAVENLLPKLLALEQEQLSQNEGEVQQAQIIREEIERIVQNNTSTMIEVPPPPIIIATSSDRKAKLAYISGVMSLEEDIAQIHVFLANPDNLSSEEKMTASVPAVLPIYNKVLLAGEQIPVPLVWASLHKQALHGLSAQAIGLSAMLNFRGDPLRAPYGVQAFTNGAFEYRTANEALLSQFKKEGFPVP